MPPRKLEPAKLNWEDGPVVRSQSFDDIYFSPIDGFEETTHVFLNGNRLQDRFSALENTTTTSTFTIGELGFGTGLNILTTCHAWQRRGHGSGHLHFVSIEGFPLSPEDFEKVQRRISETWPQLAPFSQKLKDQYPPLLPGFHVIRLADDITLTLVFGEVRRTLKEITASVDAWFLDGFAPSANPDMWSEEVVTEISRLSAHEATFATFTVAGAVRRALQRRGFSLEKVPGFGRKKEMLVGQFTSPATRQLRKKGNRVLVAGAGIAGASLAWHLRRAGFEVEVYDPEGIASGASGNPAGLLFPRLDLGESASAKFYLSAWLYTLSLLREVEHDSVEKLITNEGGYRLSLNKTDTEKIRKLRAENSLPSEFLEVIATDTLQQPCPAPLDVTPDSLHLQFRKGGTVSPTTIVQHLLGDVVVHKARIESFSSEGENEPVQVTLTKDGQSFERDTDYLIFANGIAANKYLEGKKLTASHGQVDVVRNWQLEQAITFGHYAAPFRDNTVIGATFNNVREETNPQTTETYSQENIEAVSEIFPTFPASPHILYSRASLRAVTQDRHPIAGPLPDWHALDRFLVDTSKDTPAEIPRIPNVFILSGLGARGLVTAPYCAHLIASTLSNTPLNAPADVMDILEPARFQLRQWRKER